MIRWWWSAEDVGPRIDQILDAVANQTGWLQVLSRKVDKMAQNLKDVDDALSHFEQNEDSAITDLTTAVNELVQKAQAGQDTTAEVARINAASQKLTDAAAVIKAQASGPPSP